MEIPILGIILMPILGFIAGCLVALERTKEERRIGGYFKMQQEKLDKSIERVRNNKEWK